VKNIIIKKKIKEKTLNIGKSSNTLHLGMGSSAVNVLKTSSFPLMSIIGIV